MPWQKRTLEYIDLIPELNFWSRFYPRMLKQVRFFPGLMSGSGEIEEIKEGPPVDYLNRIRDPGGGRSQIQAAYGRLMATTGEGSLFGRNLDDEDERWSFVWNDELEIEYDADENVRSITHKAGQRGSQKDKKYGPEEAVVYRMWTPHPRNSAEAESPMRSVLDIAEELIVLTWAVRATGLTRLTNGVLFMPQQASPPSAEPIGDEDALNDPYQADWADYVTAQIENFGDAEARVPFITWMDADLIEKVRFEGIHNPQTDYMERDLRKEAIERLAIGLDAPPEALRGLGSTNHWAALQILGDMWKSHGSPLAMQFAGDLAEVYLLPSLRETEYPDWNKVVIGIDASQVVVKPDRSDDADRAIDRLAIGWEGYRRMKNIPESYAPGEEERNEIAALLKSRVSSRPGAGAPSVNGRPTEEGPPEPGPEGDSGRRTRVVASAGRELGAAEMALMRCRELAGTRLRHKRTWEALEKICLDCAKTASDIPLALIPSSVGPETVKRLHLDPLVLVKGGADHLRPLLLTWGYSEAQVGTVCEMVEVYAARTLFEERTPALPSGFSSHIVGMKELTSAVVD
jgi:hypothetical protein